MDNAATSIDNDASSTASVAGKTGRGKMSSLLTRIRALEEFGFTDSMVKKRAPAPIAPVHLPVDDSTSFEEASLSSSVSGQQQQQEQQHLQQQQQLQQMTNANLSVPTSSAKIYRNPSPSPSSVSTSSSVGDRKLSLRQLVENKVNLPKHTSSQQSKSKDSSSEVDAGSTQQNDENARIAIAKNFFVKQLIDRKRNLKKTPIGETECSETVVLNKEPMDPSPTPNEPSSKTANFKHIPIAIHLAADAEVSPLQQQHQQQHLHESGYTNELSVTPLSFEKSIDVQPSNSSSFRSSSTASTMHANDSKHSSTLSTKSNHFEQKQPQPQQHQLQQQRQIETTLTNSVSNSSRNSSNNNNLNRFVSNIYCSLISSLACLF